MGEAIWSWIIRRIEREVEVIRRAPFAFSLTVLLIGAAIWCGVSTYYSSYYQGTVLALQTTIQTLEAGKSQLQDQKFQLEKDLERAKQEGGHVQRQPLPWRILKREAFLRALREAGPATLNLNYLSGDRDAAGLFADLHDLFLAGGWIIKDKANVSGGSWTGVHVVVKNREGASPKAVLLVELLRQNGIASVLLEHPTHVALTLEIFTVDIGFRP